ncbi:uncharacterized protein LOC121769759 isoform X2 [Salvia splendens]|uniref:uncharacterized protein LOC121769759 isoform X2 n=1 Tax=Salvia splendens TaxID=180675 RepID=UPI001C266657|nr:uncharacterized protein LOC121769759 isoform X2 [Salvia splendens]
MRLNRSVCRPANIGLSLRFQRRQDTKISTASLHPVLADASNLGHGLKLLGLDRLYASASAATSALEDRKPRKRPSKDERRTMVETYVNEYRISNDGKFPTVSHTIKEVGGGYYTVRQIIQEMLYNSKQSSTDAKCVSIGKSSTKENEIASNSKNEIDLTDIRNVRSITNNHDMICNSEEQSMYTKDNSSEKSATNIHEMICNSEEQSMYTRDASSKKSTIKEDQILTKFEEVPQAMELGEGTGPVLKDVETLSSMAIQSKQDQFVSVETGEPKDVEAQSPHLIDKHESIRNLDYEKEHEIHEEKVKSNASEHRAGPQESSEISERELDNVPREYADQKKSSVWNNLKSFANGILSIWKRS